ncbi:MAG: Eco57I restriction-modification methylase domain-containing protein [Marinilabiliaceae bacterium]|nr:Eco57I restriction-modification methylase domain-containing protein [Marinilabiliaceae bacterium]
MLYNIKTPNQAINPAFLKQTPNKENIENFKKELILLLQKIDENETEEFNKNLLRTFMLNIYYRDDYDINVYNDTINKIRADLAIKQKEKTTPEVIHEIKRPSANLVDMPTKDNINKKAFHELLLYYMSERTINKNKSLRHLIITNLYEWFVFDAKDFYEIFYCNAKFKEVFQQYSNRQLEGDRTQYFYDEIAPEWLRHCGLDPQSPSNVEEVAGRARNEGRGLPFVHFDIRDYKDLDIDNEDFIALYKFFSPVHLLKRDIIPDANKLNTDFYNELLHILGLTETKTDGKIKIERKTKDRNVGSLLELTIAQLQTLDLSQVEELNSYGDNTQEQLFNIALTLVITWINRILFLKLLEAQLQKSPTLPDDSEISKIDFLTHEKINVFTKVNTLFFQVLAQTHENRPAYLDEFKNVPYLNSSLFEETELEKILNISRLPNNVPLPLFTKSVLTKRAKDTLHYLLQFLNSYNFSGLQNEEENPNKLINASVLGLIFEKINGYKDGSFFTPSSITMYMCREAISRTVVEKFNQRKGWNCNTIEDLHNHIGLNREDIIEANNIFNSIRICDPAVGSGHFLVSALNEMIFIKYQLGILTDENHKRLRDCIVTVENDELIVKVDEDNYFIYNPKIPESQRIQETFFNEKQKIIENCLFGVDINPNSVKICQLRLWIELLKHAYYVQDIGDGVQNIGDGVQGMGDGVQGTGDGVQGMEHREPSTVNRLPSTVNPEPRNLKTLPNIDINIKCGNSLLSRFSLDDKYADVPSLAQRVSRGTKKYKELVEMYKSTDHKEAKRQLVRGIETEKENFYQIPNSKDLDFQNLEKANDELATHRRSFNYYQTDTEIWEAQTTELTEKVLKYETIYNEKKRGCFEWRFEFPEVLDDDGNFMGFDVVMGNPPYIQLQSMGTISDRFKNQNYQVFERTGDIYCLFYERGYQLLTPKGRLCFVTSNKWMRAGYGDKIRKFFYEKTNPELLIDFVGVKVFDEATVDVNVLMYQKTENRQQTKACKVKKEAMKNLKDYVDKNARSSVFNGVRWLILSPIEQSIKSKIEAEGVPLKDWDINIYRGITTGYNKAFIINEEKRRELIMKDPKSNEIIKPILRGRDIKKYSYEWAGLYLIVCRKNIDINKYESVYEHLSNYKNELSKKTGTNKWYELQASPSDFMMDLLNKKKIVYPETTHSANFAFIDGTIFIEKTCFMLISENAKYIQATLSSKLFEFAYKKIFSSIELGTVGYQYNKHALIKLPILLPTPEIEHQMETLLENKDYETLDRLVYGLYGLSEEEVEIIEK